MALFQFKGRGYKARFANLSDEIWDRRLGIRTFGYHPGSGSEGEPNWQVHYAPTPYVDLVNFFSRVHLNHEDIFLDLGCGLGRAVFLAAWSGVKRSIGVEIALELWTGANSNLENGRVPREKIEFVLDRAENFSPMDVSVMFLFHPFGEDTLATVLEKFASVRFSSLRPPLRIIYLNPVYNRLLEKTTWLQPTGRDRTKRGLLSSAGEYDVTFWQARE